MNASWVCRKRHVIPSCTQYNGLGPLGGKDVGTLTSHREPVIPVVTFLTPLAEHFSDLKDR